MMKKEQVIRFGKVSKLTLGSRGTVNEGPGGSKKMYWVGRS